ncbi:hypothetical protein [Citreimonas salinaria]|uniref:Uncharacterized protein n=1 Tax=Citreimonas salinaria TaxID=321339 RepID=A0A1H3MGH4_9RHOB|nr:hypothetical protein [Citreimonas salinaria]SDY75790.1 hypothetical protein SAMN05444340_11715 [Citreimonas salinaria]
MSMLSKRLEKLELRNLGGLVIFLADEFTAEGVEPIIRHACLDGTMVERGPDEPQAEFMKRVNPRNRPAATLEADCEML